MMMRTPPRGSAAAARTAAPTAPPLPTLPKTHAPAAPSVSASTGIPVPRAVPLTTSQPTTDVLGGDQPPAPLKPSVRMNRMVQTIKKALDMSVGGASTVNLRACFQDDIKADDPEFLEQLFAVPGQPGPPSVQLQEQYASELGAQSLQTLRQRLEGAFEALVGKHEINEQLTKLEELIDTAHKARIHEQATREVEETKRMEAEEKTSLTGGKVSPEELIRAERIRVMEAEKKQLETLVRQLEMKKQEQLVRLQTKKELATSAIAELEHVTQHMHEATALAQDYSRPTRD